MNFVKLVIVVVVVGVVVGIFGSVVYVEELIGMFKKIKDIGIIMLGVCDLLILFSYNVGGVCMIGYLYDVVIKIVEDVKK